MTEQWFLQDLQKEMAVRNRVLVLDPLREYDFLLRLAEEKGYVVVRTDIDINNEHWKRVYDELQLRYLIETEYRDSPVIIYATCKCLK